MSGAAAAPGGIDAVHFVNCGGKAQAHTDFAVLPVLVSHMPALSADSDDDDDGGDVQLSAIVLPTTNSNLHEWHLHLDSQASITGIKNAELPTDIRPAARNVCVEGISGHMIIDQVGDVAAFGTALANVISFAMEEDPLRSTKSTDL